MLFGRFKNRGWEKPTEVESRWDYLVKKHLVLRKPAEALVIAFEVMLENNLIRELKFCPQ